MTSQSSVGIAPLLPEHRQAVINLLMSSFFIQEPLNARLKFDLPDEPLLWVQNILDGALRDQCSFVLIDTATPHKEIVGVIINSIKNRDQKEENTTTSSEKLNFIFSLIDHVCSGYDLFELYKTDRIFSCDVINIDKKYCGQNLSADLISASLEKARRLGIRAGFVVCSSLFSRKAFIRQGFEVINELEYAKHEYELLTNMGLHDRCTLLARHV